MIRKLCFLDVETTGRRPVEKFAIIQIAGVICHEEDRQLTQVASFDLLVSPFPDDVIEPDALRVNGSSLEAIKAYPHPKKAHAKLLDAFGNQVDRFNKTSKMFFIGYNAGFDNDHMRAWFDKLGDPHFGSWFWTPPIDVMTLAGEYLMDKRIEMRDFKLGTIAETLGVKMTKAHDALSDAVAARDIYAICTGKTVL